MTLKEQALYHQIHPLKLSTDILAAVVSLYFFWLHQALPALSLHFVPPLIVSALLIRYADAGAVSKIRPSAATSAGNMTRTIEGVRLFGDLVMIFGAWTP